MLVPKSLSWSAIILLALAPSFSAAHHSFAATFDVEVVNELEGEVTSLRWRNPHVLFTLLTTDEQGSEVTYEIESHSLSLLRRMEISADALSVGDVVRVAGHPDRRTPNAMFVLNTLLPDGNEIVFDPWGDPRWSENIGTTDVVRATRDDAVAQPDGIFRVWSTAVSEPNAWPFPEVFNPSLISTYPLTEAAITALDEFDPIVDMPTLNCAAKGMPTIMEQPYPMEITDQGDRILLRLEEYDTLRIVHMNRADAPANQPYSILGYSTGHWDGDTLVVRTTNVNWPFFDSIGLPLTEEVEIVERFTPSDDGSRLDLSMRVTDPSTFTETVEVSKTWLALPGSEVQPYECTN